MEQCRIIDYSEEYRSLLRDYLYKTFPEYSREYIEYLLDTSAGNVPSIMVINEKDEVVGCHLYYCTKVMLRGNVSETHWGYDTFLEPDYRAEIGLELMLRINATIGFGIGLTEINSKIQKKLKAVFFSGVYTYYTASWKFYLSPFQLLFGSEPKLFEKDVIRTGNYTFKRIRSVDELEIPNEGFWLGGKFDIEFVRDSTFIKDRFLENTVHPYLLFANINKEEPCYFVVRKTRYRGFPALTLCDYRYTTPKMVSIILRAVKKIACKSNLGIILFVSGNQDMDEAMKHTIHYASPIDFVSNNKKIAGMSFFVTGADSDADFLKG